MRMNRNMRDLTSEQLPHAELDEALLKFAGVPLIADGAYLNPALVATRVNLRKSDYGDATAYEHAMNRLFIDDHVDGSPLELIGQAFALIRRIANDWAHVRHAPTLRFIVATQAHYCWFSYHVLRDGETQVGDDVESYEINGVLVVDSNETLLLRRSARDNDQAQH